VPGAGASAGPDASAARPGTLSPPRPTVGLRVASSGSPGGSGANALRRESPSQGAVTAPTLDRFEDLIALAHEKRDLALAYALERDVRLVGFERGRIEFEPSPGAKDDLAKTMARRLLEWTGERWLVAVSPSPGTRTLGEKRDLKRKSAVDEAMSEPLVRAILERFPGAEIVNVRDSLAPTTEELDEDVMSPSDFDPGSDESEDPFEFLDTLPDDDFRPA
jgi:DNA polymerase-3 subunit gamma/tau